MIYLKNIDNMNEEKFYYLTDYSLPTCICLNVTDDCNLACKYCFVQQKPHYMTLDVAKKSVDFIIKNHKEKEELYMATDLGKPSITFFGGEPTLMWEKIIVPLVDYIETKYPDQIDLGMTTNGTLLNEERLTFLKEHNIGILLSMDGSEKTQNYNRPCKNGQNSFDLVNKNIPKILEYFPCTTFRATIHQDTCENLFDTYMFATKNGFQHIFFCPNAREKWKIENIEKLKKEINKIFAYFICSFINNQKPIQCELIDNAFRKILKHDLQVFYDEYEPLSPNCSPFRCGLGATSASISYDGKIFSCQEQDSRDTSDYFYIGNIYDGIDHKKHEVILKDYTASAITECENKNLCENCLLRKTCIEETCPSVSKDMFDNFFIKPEIDCIFTQSLFENALIAMDILVNNDNNELFKKYLNQLYIDYIKDNKKGEEL